MKAETKWKIKYHTKRIVNGTKTFIKEWLPWLGLGAAIGYVAGGCACGIHASKEVEELKTWANEEAVPKANRAINRGLDNEQRVIDLERQVNTLMEKALNVTEGKETAE